MVPDHGEEGRAIFLQLDGADAVNAGKLVERGRPLLRHFDQRPVGKNDIGRLFLRRRDRAAQGFQRRQQLRVRDLRQRRRARLERRAFALTTSSRRAKGASPRSTRLPSSVRMSRSRSFSSRSISFADCNCRRTPRQSAGVRSLPTPKVLSSSCPCRCDRLGRLAGKDVGEMAEKEPARSAQNRRQRFLRVDPSVDQPDRALADVAMAARAGLFAEHAQKRLSSAARRFAQGHEIVELGHLDALALVGRPALENLATPEFDVACAVKREGVRRQAVAAGAADLLIIGFDRRGHVGVKDEADVRLVDAHAEGDGGADNAIVLAQEGVVIGRAHRMLEPGVIGQRAPADAREFLRRALPFGGATRNRRCRFRRDGRRACR